MNYIWEIILESRKNGINESELFFKQPKEFSPYYEQSFSDIDTKSIYEGGEIEINGLYRFDSIISRLFAPDLEEYEELRNYLYDMAMHFLSSIDLYSGLSKQDIYSIRIRRSIERGEYGEFIAESFKSLDKDSKNMVVLELFKSMKLGSSVSRLRQVLKKLYKDIILYQLKEEPNFVLIYIGIKKNTYEEEKLKLVIELFLPIEYKVRAFWKDHFGVIGVDETMALDGIEIF